MSTHTVYLGLGANLGDRAANIEEALERIESEKACAVVALSPLYETEPWGYLDQPRFVNAACRLETALAPHALLDALKGIERAMGRRPETRRYGPRPIDLDILLYDDLVLESERLIIPHPGLTERATVLVPLCDIAPAVCHPVTGKTMRQHLQALGAVEGVVLLDSETP